VVRWQHCRCSCSKVGGWEREQLGKTVPQPKGNFLMELTDLYGTPKEKYGTPKGKKNTTAI
jgi:hypothetical protein